MISLTVLVENTARGAGILGEHGLSYWIDTGAHRVLFDTGQGMALLNNAKALGIDLARADAVVLSHGHFDHAGGLEAALAVAWPAALYLHPRATEKKFSGADPAAGARCISTPFVETEWFLRDKRRVIVTREPCEVVSGVWTTGEIPRTNDFEDTGGPFYLDEALTQPDPLLDDQALFFTTRAGVVVVLGCAHAGVVNTLEHICHLTHGAPIHTVLGGMHLENASPRRVAETLAAFRHLDVHRIGAVHCTGFAAVATFWREFPTRCIPCAAGTRLTFEPAA
ncbi:MAG: MBL fold metallo-hydrolase [Opitutaceae bacterium]|nr:MBL fold metallo-hydrolase [Opitutaceae bacterium]